MVIIKLFYQSGFAIRVVIYEAGADRRIKGEKTMQANIGDATAAAAERLELCFSGPDCNWARFYQPKDESMAMGSRYHLFYPALAYFVELKTRPRPGRQD